MATYYAVWDGESRNFLADYPSKDEALELVRDLMLENGPECGESLMLLFGQDGVERLVAEGTELVRMALAAAAPSDASPVSD